MTQLETIVQSPVFSRQKKKLYKQQVKDLDTALQYIFNTPGAGDMKAGDLQAIQVYKFKSGGRQFLLAYEVIDSALFLYTFGLHENFYRDLKKYLHH
jgi:hypothetical protein